MVELENSDVLADSQRLEGEYNWKEAADRYEELLDASSSSKSSAELNDLRGFALYRFAMQAETKNEFLRRINEAIACYERVKALLDKDKTGRKSSRVARADAWINYLQYWVEPRQSQKLKLLDKAWSCIRDALVKFKASGDLVGFCKTYIDLGTIPVIRIWFQWNSEAREMMLREILALAQETLEFLSGESVSKGLAAAYLRAAGSMFYLADDFDPKFADDIRKYVSTGREYWSKAQELSAEQAFVESLSSLLVSPFTEDTGVDAQIKFYEQALSYARRSHDKYMTGSALDWLAQYNMLKSLIIEDSKEATILCNKALEYAQGAGEQYSRLSFVSPRAGVLWVGAPLAEYYAIISLHETDPHKKGKILERAANELQGLLEQARTSAYPDTIWDSHHVASKTLLWLSRTQIDWKDRERILRRSMRHRLEAIRISRRLQPHFAGGLRRSLDMSYMADLESELSETHATSSRKRLLEDATRNKQKALTLLVNYEDILLGEPDTDYNRRIRARLLTEYGDLLGRLFKISDQEDDLRRAATSYKNASEIFDSLDQPSRAAECRWKASAAYDELGDYETASNDFMTASTEYLAAATKFPEHEKFYQDYSIYMQAWSEIERARNQHSNDKYSEAAEHFLASSKILEKTSQWKYLAPSYAAFSYVENGERLSRNDRSQDASQEFEKAERLFQETCLAVQTNFGDTKAIEEKRVVTEVTSVAKLRADYSKARKYIEEGRVLGRKGDNHASVERYRLAVVTLEKISELHSSGNLQVDVKYSLSVVRALHVEAQAETESSPGLYRKASSLFEKASHFASTEASRTLLIGHAQLCLALSFAQRFLSTGNVASHNRAVQLLENAMRYYVRAGFHNASGNAKATRRILDACIYLNRAGSESDEERKTKLYTAAEKLLKVAGEIYGETGHTAYREQALRLLESAREEKEIAVSLTGVFQPQSLQSLTTPPMLASERPVGVEKFQGAYVRANLASYPESPRLGEPLSLRIELANAGAAPAQLVMVEKVIPEGFEVVNKPSELPVEGDRLILNGRRLDPLKTQKLEIILRPKANGPFAVRPRLSYIDEKGSKKFHEPTPLEIVVSTSDTTPANGQVPVLFSSPMVEFLGQSFVKDYMRKRLPIEKSGWRCLSEIASSLRIPKSQVYGDSRYGHTFAKPLEKLVRSGIAEFRIFPGERGRGGKVIKIRVNYEREPVKRLVDTIALKTQ